MTNYFVRQTGDDASAGTSAGTAWRTIGKALGASGIASGDTVYIGAGIYREVVTVAMTSAVAETKIIGDVDGAQTGDAGEVILSNFTNGWNDTPGSGDPINLAGRDFLTFQNLTILAGGTGNCVDGSTATSTNITLTNCYLVGYGATAIIHTTAFGTASNWTIQNCFVLCMSGTNTITFTMTTGVGADYDANIVIKDSVIWGVSGSGTIFVTNSGTAANKGGGVDVLRCTIFGASALTTTATNVSTTVPCTLQDSLTFGTNQINAGSIGQVTDLGGNVSTGGNTNVTSHAITRNSADDFPVQFLSSGHEWMWGMQPRQAFAPFLPGTLGRGQIGAATVDIAGRARPEGTSKWYDSGTATSGAATTMTDTNKSWGTNEHIGRLVRITGGTGSGQVKHISSNTATVLTIGGKDGDWATTPNNTSTYIIYDGPPVTTGKATAGAASTLTDGNAAWSTNKWGGYTVETTGGTGSGQTRTINSNTATQLTVSSNWTTNPDTTTTYSIYWPSTSLTASGAIPGVFEAHDTALKETTTTDAGSVGITIHGPGSHEFLIPVDAASTTISVKMRYDANHATTNKPQAILLANVEIGVTTETKTMTSAADTWETLTFAAQTPSAKGVVTVRLVSRSAAPYGKAFADTWAVT